MRMIQRLLLLLLVIALGAGAYLYRDYRLFSDRALRMQAHEVVLDVHLGTSFRSIVRKIKAATGNDAPWWYWRALAHEMGVLDGLHAGEYALTQNMTPRRLLRRMADGDVIHHQFTIIEGWRFRELRLALSREERLEQTLNALSDDDVMERIGAGGVHPEGRFLPETYSFVRGQKDVDVLKRAYKAMQSRLAQRWAERDPQLPLGSPDEMLTLASIVEKETGRAGERSRIAGVFVRRLKMPMMLQTDPTVIYGIGDSYNGNITRRHLETDTPYNTYTRFGLPPTPIALPGDAALLAVARPAAGDELYFVAKGNGEHAFSATLAEHNRAVREYQLR
ncbi:MAG: endolytic transglycosylase MltG [Xanthomonadales bacterium]|nr:endolytic transglycosylase MltG [Xanthomonadales bacterium]MBK7146856.1 endolytic transglycosylase MltG [Xanthomonadales bacterium]